MANALPIQTRYDQPRDVLYLSFGAPQKAWTQTDDKDERIQWRYTMADDQWCGVTILNYSTWCRRELLAHLATVAPIPPNSLPDPGDRGSCALPSAASPLAEGVTTGDLPR